MYEHRRSPTHFYYTAPYAVPVYGNVSYPAENSFDTNWYRTWPKLKSLYLAVVIIMCSAAIIGLDIANIAIETSKQSSSKLGLDTGKVGAGIWSGAMSFFAAIFILSTAFMRNKRISATFALVAVTLAFFFLIVLIGLIGNSIQKNLYANDRTDTDNIQNRLLIAILSIACALTIFCIIFFIIFVRVFFSSSTRPSA